MKINGVIIEKGFNSGDSNTVNPKGAVIENRPYHILFNHDPSLWVGLAHVYVKDNEVIADMYFHDEFNNVGIDGYPSLGFKVLEKENGIIESFKVLNIGICSLPNNDPTIKKISKYETI
jgi:hypothetical protein